MKTPRLYRPPIKSFFLFGPRGVGKSTWVRDKIDVALEIDLLRHRTFLELQNDPGLLEAKAAPLRKHSWIFIDEIQKLPSLLDEVHHLIEAKGYRFVLTGSSARKLKRGGANLLAGRALTHKMFPLSLHELSFAKPIRYYYLYGTMPLVLKESSQEESILYSYVETYLREEIKEEAVVRRIDRFNRFLQIAGRLNGQVVNQANVARETGRSGALISQWYDILEETLLGIRLMPYRPAFKVREAGHPKFYWFDPGVARVSAQIGADDFETPEMGFAFETLILNELRVYQEYSGKIRPISYYATPGAGEIDFIIELRPKTLSHPPEFLTIEVKMAAKWKRDFEGPTRALKEFAGPRLKRMIGIYLGSERLAFDGFEVYPLQDFVKALFEGKVW